MMKGGRHPWNKAGSLPLPFQVLSFFLIIFSFENLYAAQMTKCLIMPIVQACIWEQWSQCLSLEFLQNTSTGNRSSMFSVGNSFILSRYPSTPLCCNKCCKTNAITGNEFVFFRQHNLQLINTNICNTSLHFPHTPTSVILALLWCGYCSIQILYL